MNASQDNTHAGSSRASRDKVSSVLAAFQDYNKTVKQVPDFRPLFADSDKDLTDSLWTKFKEELEERNKLSERMRDLGSSNHSGTEEETAELLSACAVSFYALDAHRTVTSELQLHLNHELAQSTDTERKNSICGVLEAVGATMDAEWEVFSQANEGIQQAHVRNARLHKDLQTQVNEGIAATTAYLEKLRQFPDVEVSRDWTLSKHDELMARIPEITRLHESIREVTSSLPFSDSKNTLDDTETKQE